MKRFKKATAFFFAAVMILSTALSAYAIAVIDEDGNIVENEPLEGGIIPLTGDLEIGEFEMDPMPAFSYATGMVTEFWQNEMSDTEFIRIETGEDIYLDFQLDMNTFLMGDEIKIGDTITGVYDNYVPMLMIYPPQHTALVLINREDDLPRIIVDRFCEEWLNSNQAYRLNITDSTEIVYQNGDPFTGERDELVGRLLVVEFMISNRDIPETIPNPLRITILYERAVHPIITIDVEMFPDDTILPMPEFIFLREMTETLGFTPEWNAERREITVGSPQGEVTMRIGSPEYTVTSPSGVTSVFTFEPPEIVNDRTQVPFAFFREIYGL